MQIASSARRTGERVPVGLAVDDGRLDPEGPAGAQDPDGDLAPVRDQDLLEHRRLGLAQGSPGGPDSARPELRTAAPGSATAVAPSPARAVRPSRRRGRQELDPDELLAVLDRLAGLDEAGPDDPVGRRDDLGRDAEDVDRADRVAGADARSGDDPGARLEEADGRRGRHGPERVAAAPARLGGADVAVGAAARGPAPRARRPRRGPGPTGVSDGRAGRRRRRRAAGAPARRPGPRRRPAGGGGPSSRPRGPRSRRGRSRRAWR